MLARVLDARAAWVALAVAWMKDKHEPGENVRTWDIEPKKKSRAKVTGSDKEEKCR